jgi:CheY-like chemotaxis protein
MREIRRAPARLLVADDNKVNRLLLTRSLELQGHRSRRREWPCRASRC